MYLAGEMDAMRAEVDLGRLKAAQAVGAAAGGLPCTVKALSHSPVCFVYVLVVVPRMNLGREEYMVSSQFLLRAAHGLLRSRRQHPSRSHRQRPFARRRRPAGMGLCTCRPAGEPTGLRWCRIYAWEVAL